MFHRAGDGHGIPNFLEYIRSKLFYEGIIDVIEVHEACGHIRGVLGATIEFESFSGMRPALFVVIRNGHAHQIRTQGSDSFPHPSKVPITQGIYTIEDAIAYPDFAGKGGDVHLFDGTFFNEVVETREETAAVHVGVGGEAYA